MRILAVTSWGGACGIANYAEQLIEAVGQADPSIHLEPMPATLDPQVALDYLWRQPTYFDVIWLNYHRGLHSRWTPEALENIRREYASRKVVITFHDTYGERPPDDLTQHLHDLADAFVVHEPCEGLPKQILIRQGVPAGQMPTAFEWVTFKGGIDAPFVQIVDGPPGSSWMRVPPYMPILGTVGFNFPWKNFDRLAEVTAEAGWAYLVLSNNATNEDAARWIGKNPWTCVVRGFRPTSEIVSWLSACDATCFPYECANSGTSGAIRLGLAARKPVIAWGPCRQFSDLWLGQDGEREPDPRINWVWNWENLVHALSNVPIQRVDPGIAYLAHRDSWVNQGRRYAEVFSGVAG